MRATSVLLTVALTALAGCIGPHAVEDGGSPPNGCTMTDAGTRVAPPRLASASSAPGAWCRGWEALFDADTIDLDTGPDDAGTDAAPDDASIDAGADDAGTGAAPRLSPPPGGETVPAACRLPPQPAACAHHEGPLLGVADLHLHLATHLAFAGDEGGHGGLIWGHPAGRAGDEGLRWRGTVGGPYPLEDPGGCDPDLHDDRASDPVRRATRSLLMNMLQSLNGHFPHGSGIGAAVPAPWPNGRDVIHQAVQISALRRAFDGGVRLVVASATDAQTIALALDVNVFPGGLPLSRERERDTAERQLEFIHRLVRENSSWMQIVTSADEAECAIRSNRMAVVLNVELDALSVEDIEYLADRWGVRHVTPIHFTDNDFGGAAAYQDLFNLQNRFMGTLFGRDREFLHVLADPALSTRLARPMDIRLDYGGLLLFPRDLDWNEWLRLGYESVPACGNVGLPRTEGHRNALGLIGESGVRRLMARGIMVDLAHMSDATAHGVVALSERFAGITGHDGRSCAMPLHSSHTGVRPRDANRGSDRDLDPVLWDQIASRGGVLGFGTEGRSDEWDREGVHLSATGTPLLVLDVRQPDAAGQDAPLRDLRSGGQPIVRVEGASVATDSSAGDGTWVELRVRGRTARGGLLDVSTAGGVLDVDAGPGAEPRTLSIEPYQRWAAESGVPGVAGSCQPLWEAPNPPAIVGATVEWPGSPSTITLSSRYPRVEIDLPRPAAADAGPGDAGPGDAGSVDAGGPGVPLTPRRTLRLEVIAGTELASPAWPLLGAELCAQVVGPTVLDRPELRGGCRSGEISINFGAGWQAHKGYVAYVPVQCDSATAPRCQVETVRFRLQSRDLIQDRLEIETVRVDLVLDPVRLWMEEYREMLGCGPLGTIALGTDLNGLQTQLAFSDIETACTRTTYALGEEDPIAACGSESARRFSVAPLTLDGHQLDLSTRGLANFGMLPDLFQAIATYEAQEATMGRVSVLDSLFLSAARFIELWRETEQRAVACDYGGVSFPGGP